MRSETGNAVKALMDSLASKAKVKRNGTWSEIESADLVPSEMQTVVLPRQSTSPFDQAALTGESLPQAQKLSLSLSSGSAWKQGEAQGIVISTGVNTFFGRATSLIGQDDDSTGHLQKILAQIGSFCLMSMGVFDILIIIILYPHFLLPPKRILVLLIRSIPIAMQMPTVLSVILSVELAGHTLLCSDKTGALTINKLAVDQNNIKTYGPFSADEVILLAAYASCTESQDAIDASVVTALGDVLKACAGIKLLDFKPFKPSNPPEELENKLKAGVEEYVTRGLRALALAYEELDGHDHEAKGNGFELIGLLAVFDPPCDNTKQTVDDALALCVKVKTVTSDQLAIQRNRTDLLGTPGGKHPSLDKIIMNADGFAGVFPEYKHEIVKHLQGLGHLCAITGDGANDVPALSCTTVGIAVEGATDAAHGAADIILTESGLQPLCMPHMVLVSSSNSLGPHQ
ncbi:HAD-like domain-containing protein [Lentinula raphanica]|nr:HAD-like domain-containing protein [Lentinula raphanica]